MNKEKFLAKAVYFNHEKNQLTLKLDFLMPEQLEIIEKLIIEKSNFSFSLGKPFRRLKTYAQLKKYYATINEILYKLNIIPTSEIVKAFDEEFKKTCFPASHIQICEQKIPIIKSKADMTVEELSFMIEQLYNVYGELLEEV